MGILRADKITGLGGANAIKGSVEFRADQNIHVEIVNGNADFNYGSGDFTIECWWNSGGDLSTDINFVTLWNYASDRQAWGMYWDADDGNFGLIASTGGSIGSTDITYRQAANFEKNKWYHLAIVRISNTLTLYKNGTSIGSNSSFTGTIYENTVDPLIIGGQMSGTTESSKIMRGFISNLRIIKGEGIYTGNFTPPTNELTVTPNTVLLACQSPGDILQEATGKKLFAYRRTLNSTFPIASRFTPNTPVGFSTTTDVGSQYGATFDGFTVFATSTYMVPPAGNTRERNRGRAVIGWANNPVNTGMDVFNIQSMGNATAFGSLTSGNKWGSHAFSSTTRGLWAGGYINSGPAFFNTIEFVTIASNGNPIDFGDTTSQNYRSGCCSSSTRGVIALGFVAPNFSKVNTIDQVTMATAGNATNFGDLFQTRANMASASSPTRGFFAGGETPTYVNTIDFVTIASAGDASNFGDLNSTLISSMAMASTTRGIIGGGYPTPANTNVIDFITIASTGDATDFGDLTGLYSVGSATSNNTRGVFCGGYTAPSKHNLMEFVTIATTGNASDFGDMTYARRDFGVCSDSHGGLS